MTSAANEVLANGDGVDQDCGGFVVLMEGGGPWGFSLQGGTDFRSPLRISRVGSHGKAAKAGLSAGNIIVTINGQATVGLKHIEAQRLIKMSGDTLELHCSRNLPRVISPTINKPTFVFPQSPSTPSAGKSSTLGRVKPTSNIQSTPIPSYPMRPRSSSDAKRQVKHPSGIPLPTPPPSYRGHSHKHSIGSTGSDSMSSTSLSPMEAGSPVSTWDQQPSSDTTSAQCPPDEEQDTEKDEGVQMDEEEPFQEKRKTAAKGRIAGWIDSRVLTQQQQNKPEVDQGTTSVKEDSTKDIPDSKVVVQPPPFSPPASSEPKETKKEATSDVDSSYFLKSSGGDWYKQMFQSLKQNVDGQFPDKKKVWDRSPTPVRKSSYEFKSSTDIDYVKSHSQRPAKTQSPQHSRSASYGEESAIPAPTVSKRMSRPNSSSTIPQQKEVSPNMVFRRTSSGHVGGSSVVYRKNSPGYSNSRDYWKQLERKSSQEALANRRGSLTRGRSLSSSSAVSDVATSEQPNILQSDSRTPPESPFEKQSATLFEEETAPSTEVQSLPVSDSKASDLQQDPVVSSEFPEEQSSSVDSPPTEEQSAAASIPPEEQSAAASIPPEEQSAAASIPPEEQSVAASIPPEEQSVAAVSEHSSHPTSPELDEVMSKLHPILQTEPSEEKSEEQDGEAASGIFNRIDPTKLSNALGNAVTIGTMEQEGASPLVLQSAALMAGSPQPQPQQQPKKKPKAHKPPPGEKAKGLHDFIAASEKELSFKKGDILTLTRTVDQNWLEGTLNGKTGIFPNNFIKVLTAEEIATLGQEQEEEPVKEEEQTLNQIAKAKYDFTAKTARELSFRKGEVITLLKQLDDNWYRGRTEEGEEGIVPSSYIQLLDSADQ